MANLSGSGAPTKTTVGAVGDIYTDSLTSIQYELSSIVTITDREGSRLEYVWDRVYEFGEGGGSGTQGPPGPAGADGEDGGYYTPSVAENGDLTWTASDSSMPEVPGANIKGPKGDTGEEFSPTAIPANTDLDEFLIRGEYYCVATASLNTITNKPIENYAFLLINKTLGGNASSPNPDLTQQIFIANRANRIFTRYLQPVSEINTGWAELATIDDLSGYLPVDGNAATATTLKQNIISNGVDFNEIKTSGVYTRINSGGTYQNAPNTRAGLLIVQNISDVPGTDDDVVVFQTYFAYQQYGTDNNSPFIYNRSYYATDDEWSPWSRVAYESELENYLPINGNAESATRPLIQAIERNTTTPPNLNDYVYTSFYSIASGDAGTITNEPVSGAMGLLYIYTSNVSTNYVIQRFYRLDAEDSASIYQRTCNNGTWSGWTKIVTEETLETATVAKAKELTYTDVFTIAETVDLDTIQENGWWYNTEAVSLTELLNAPIDNVIFALQVITTPNAAYTQQIFHDLTNNTIYIRSCKDNQWTDWVSMINGTTA